MEEEAVVLNYRVRNWTATEWKFIERRVPLTWTDCHFDGRRPWFCCSVRTNGRYCGRRVAVLFGDGELFGCRNCYQLAYESQQENPFLRSIQRSEKIRMLLGGPPNPFGPLPKKPVGMWRRTYDRHCATLARMSAASTFLRAEKYRRWNRATDVRTNGQVASGLTRWPNCGVKRR
jgi:hypothetical protein